MALLTVVSQTQNAIAQATQPSGWQNPEVVIPLVVSAVISILAWWMANRAAGKAERAETKAAGAEVKATTADVKADVSTKAVSEVRQDVRSLNEQVTTIAQAQPPPNEPPKT